mmetsp:Transcript_93668/g.190674  ORF Transcript_93668/g.190674 Transcript_93668/m.190674 type:complete len:382 (-) Transcript_93668:235-1380(-)
MGPLGAALLAVSPPVFRVVPAHRNRAQQQGTLRRSAAQSSPPLNALPSRVVRATQALLAALGLGYRRLRLGAATAKNTRRPVDFLWSLGLADAAALSEGGAPKTAVSEVDTAPTAAPTVVATSPADATGHLFGWADPAAALEALTSAAQDLAATVATVGVTNNASDRGIGPAEQLVDDLVGADVPQHTRNFLKAGSLYQNPYMTLWNNCGVPVSATLRVHEADKFELLVRHLDSKNNGSEGWIEFRGSVRLERIPNEADRWSIKLIGDNKGGALERDALVYDEALFNRSSAFALGCLKRCGASALSAFRLEVDARRDVVYVEPRNAALRFFWDESVGLELTTEDQLWEPRSIKEGYGPSAAATLVSAGASQHGSGLGLALA